MTSLTEAFEKLWGLLGYAVLFLIPILILSPTTRSIFKVFILNLLSEEAEGEAKPKVKGVPEPLAPSPVVSKAVMGAIEVPVASSAAPSPPATSTPVDPRAVAEELRRRIDSGEELDEEFIIRTASVLGIPKETIYEAFDVPTDSSSSSSASSSALPPSASSFSPASASASTSASGPGPTPLPPPSSAAASTENPTKMTVSPEPLATDWIRDLLPEGQEVGLLSSIHESEGLKDANGKTLDYSDFTESHVYDCLSVFRDTTSTQEEKVKALVMLSCITETTEPAGRLNRREKHSNQVRLLNAVMEHDGLAAIHDVQSSFAEARHRQLAAHTLARIASKLYEGWN